MVQIAAAFTEFHRLDSVGGKENLVSKLKDLVSWSDIFVLNQVRLGNEFCERLIPTKSQVRKAAEIADRFDLDFVLVLANLTDKGLKKLGDIIPNLSQNAEIVVNDWGTAAMIAENFPDHPIIAGRLLCKHLKEARISTPDTYPEVNWPINSDYFKSILQALRIERAEVDLAPHTVMPAKKVKDIAVTLHLNCGYSAKSHVCKIGSTRQPAGRKFVPEHLCQRECLSYKTVVSKLRYPTTHDLEMFQRGNTWFYTYTSRMNASVNQAILNGSVDRAVVTLD